VTLLFLPGTSTRNPDREGALKFPTLTATTSKGGGDGRGGNVCAAQTIYAASCFGGVVAMGTVNVIRIYNGGPHIHALFSTPIDAAPSRCQATALSRSPGSPPIRSDVYVAQTPVIA
jgi:hypothetical protein